MGIFICRSMCGAGRNKIKQPLQMVVDYAKTVYRGVAKNMSRFHILFTSGGAVEIFLWHKCVHFRNYHKELGVQEALIGVSFTDSLILI